MQKGKVYTIVGVQGIKLSRTQGLSVLYDGQPVEFADADAVDQDNFDAIANMGTENFINEGLDLFVEADLENGKLVNADVLDEGSEGCYDDLFNENYDDEDEDDGDEDADADAAE